MVASIIQDVRQRGDQALLDSARKFDAPALERLYATQEEIDEAMPLAEHAFAIDHAIERVQAFHQRQLDVVTAGWQKHEYQTAEERKRDGQPRHHVGNYRWTWNLASEPARVLVTFAQNLPTHSLAEKAWRSCAAKLAWSI